jgi:hypothetical protein
MANENRDWGYRRILGALSNLGYCIARGRVANILQRHGIEPAPERERKTTWKEFLKRHWGSIDGEGWLEWAKMVGNPPAQRGIGDERARQRPELHRPMLYQR